MIRGACNTAPTDCHTGPSRQNDVYQTDLAQLRQHAPGFWTRFGPRQMFALAFIHLGTRRVYVTPATDSTNSRWMEHQARVFLDHAAAEGLPCEIIIRDHDGAYSEKFDRVFKDKGIRVKPVGPKAPNLNVYIERWIQSLKQEALDHFLIFGKTHFDYIVSEYVAYYHECRPHQGLDNRLLPLPRGIPHDEDDVAPFDPGKIKCEHRLGGILKHYYLDAA